MRTLTIGSTTLEITGFFKRWDRGRGVYAEIGIPTSAIAYDELKALFTNNAEDLIVTGEDGSTESHSGYAVLDEVREKDGVYTVIQYCTETAMHLLNEAKKQIDAQADTIATQSAEIAILAEENASSIEFEAELLYELSLMQLGLL